MEDDKIQIAVLKTRMDQLEKNLGDKLDRLAADFAKYVDRSEERFAAKWTESAMKTVITLVCVGVAGAVLALVLK